MKLANETACMFKNRADNLADREQFVKNLGWLLSQTRERVTGCTMSADGDIVYIHYKGGSTVSVGIAMNSYIAIVRDVTRHI